MSETIRAALNNKFRDLVNEQTQLEKELKVIERKIKCVKEQQDVITRAYKIFQSETSTETEKSSSQGNILTLSGNEIDGLSYDSASTTLKSPT